MLVVLCNTASHCIVFPILSGAGSGWMLGWLTCVGVGLALQLRAGVQVCEGTDPQAVCGVQLGLQELTTHLPHIHQLQQTGSGEQHLGGERGSERELPQCILTGVWNTGTLL